MFDGNFASQITGTGLKLSRVKGGDMRTINTLGLKYDFTEQVAEAIGGDAPEIQRMLDREGSGDCKSQVATVTLHLDTSLVLVKLDAGAGDEVTIERTESIGASASLPTVKGGTTPSLTVSLAFRLDAGEEEFDAFVREQLGRTINVNMSRAQDELDFGHDPYHGASGAQRVVLEAIDGDQGIPEGTKTSTLQALLKLAIKNKINEGDPVMEAVSAEVGRRKAAE